MGDGHLAAQPAGQGFLQLPKIEGDLVPALLLGPLLLLLNGLDQGLRLTDGQAALHHVLSHLPLEGLGGRPQNGPGVAGGEGALLHHGQ